MCVCLWIFQEKKKEGFVVVVVVLFIFLVKTTTTTTKEWIIYDWCSNISSTNYLNKQANDDKHAILMIPAQIPDCFLDVEKNHKNLKANKRRRRRTVSK
mgnify:CR=1 FL=1